MFFLNEAPYGHSTSGQAFIHPPAILAQAMADSKAAPFTKDRVVGCNLDNYIARALFKEFVPLACIKEGHAALWPLTAGSD
jgi:hypothetical protein